jgi:hypothetical protein
VLQSFAVNQPVTAGHTYMFALISGTPTANVWWANGQPAAGSACNPGPADSGYAGGQWLGTLPNDVFSFRADFATPLPPAASPSPVTFPGQPADTIGPAQTVTISSPGEVTTTVGQLSVAGANGSDFVVVADQCSGQTLTAGQSCTVGLRIAPQAGATAARAGTLKIPYAYGGTPPAGADNPPAGVVTDALSGTAEPVPAGTSGTPGPPGPAGADGRIELVTCTTVTKTVRIHGHRKRVTDEQCSTKLVSGTVKFTISARTVATLSHSGIVYASGWVSGPQVTLAARRAITPGRYTLSEHRGRVTTRRQVSVG